MICQKYLTFLSRVSFNLSSIWAGYILNYMLPYQTVIGKVSNRYILYFQGIRLMSDHERL